MHWSIIVAMTPDRVIGRYGQLPWRLSADLRRFKQLTMGHHIIMGRKTYDSIGRLLPGRRTIIVSRQKDLVVPGADVAHCVEEAQQICQDDPEVFFVGGQQIYAAALAIATRLYLTIVHAHVPGDAHFPEISSQQWQLVEQEHHRSDERNQYDYTFQLLQRAVCDDD
jgi:dihydrofolate reductase